MEKKATKRLIFVFLVTLNNVDQLLHSGSCI